MAKAYRVKQDVSLPRAIRPIYDDSTSRNGLELYQTEGRNYAAGDYVLAEDITPPLRKKAEDGDLDHLLEPVDPDEAKNVLDEQARASRVSTFTPEHATEAHAMELAGHEVEEGSGTEQVVPEEVSPDASTESVVSEVSDSSEPKAAEQPKKASPRRKTKKVSG